MADFEVYICSRAKSFVEDQDLDKAITKVLKNFHGVANLCAEQRSFAGFTNAIREVVISTNSWTLC